MVTTKIERDVEQALMDRLQDTLMELGRGMSLVGRQFRLPLKDGDEFVIDLLLFHVEQLRYVVELKVGPSMPAHLGQLGAYVAAADGDLRRPDIHVTTVGILLGTGTGGAGVQCALASTATVARYQGMQADAREALRSAVELQVAPHAGWYSTEVLMS